MIQFRTPGRILLATDGGLSAETVLAAGISLLRQTGASLTICCVAPTVVGPEGVRWPGPAARAEREAMVLVQREVVLRALPTANVTVSVVEGHPSVEIARAAEGLQADLILLGRRPQAEAGGHALGPTADEVVRRASVPCLAIPAGGWVEAPSIIAALDGSERGLLVFNSACSLARAVGGSLRAVTVEPGVPAADGLRVIGARADRLNGRLGQVVTDLAAQGHCPTPAPGGVLTIRQGDPVAEVIREAAAADVLAVGIHRGGVPGTLGGRGVSRRIVHGAPGSVLTIPL